ncbi:hypothetical protein D918_08205 [Trichuris suis]|nr:hypothetical protein D918_08205 [Trichuris suis]
MLRGLSFLLVVSLSAAAGKEPFGHPLNVWKEGVLEKLNEMRKLKPEFFQELHTNLPSPYKLTLKKTFKNWATYVLMVSAILHPNAQTFTVDMVTADGALFYHAINGFPLQSIIMQSDLLPKSQRTETIMIYDETFEKTEDFYCVIVMNPHQWQVYYEGKWYFGRLDPPSEISLIDRVELSGDYRTATIALTTPYGINKQDEWVGSEP